MTKYVRPVLYGAASLGGVKLVNWLSPVDAATLGSDASVGEAVAGFRSGVANGLGAAVGKAGGALAGVARDKITQNIIMGVALGCVVAGVVDLFVLS